MGVDAARMNVTLRDLLDTCEEDVTPTPLAGVSTPDLRRVADFCEARTDEKRRKEEVEQWDLAFCAAMTPREAVSLLHVADLLENRPLSDVVAAHVARRLRKLSAARMREVLGIEADLTPEEEEEVRASTSWLFDEGEDRA